jgi:multidrug efflux pump
MMCSRILRRTPEEQQGRFYKASERVFQRVIAFYGRTLKYVLGYQTITLLIAAATLVLTIVLYIVIPKGFFPTQDTGVIQGISQAPATISFAAMAQKQQQLAGIILQDPAVESLSSFIGADGTNTTLNSGRMSINLKPLNVRNISASDVIRRLQTSLQPVEGITLFMDPVQNITVDDRVSRTQYQYTLEDPDAAELNLWTGRLVEKMKQLPQLADVATDQQTGGLAVSLVIDRVSASRLGIAPSTIDSTLYDAYGQRQISTMYTQLNQYHVILEAAPNFQQGPGRLQDLYVRARSLLFLRILRFFIRGFECNDDYGGLHSVLGGTERAFKCHQVRGWREQYCINHKCNDHYGFCQCRTPQCLYTYRESDRGTLDQSPGAVSGGDRILQSRSRCRAGRRDYSD